MSTYSASGVVRIPSILHPNYSQILYFDASLDLLIINETKEVLCVCGQWISKKSVKWEFQVDANRNASFISIGEDLHYEDLIKIVSEDFCVKEAEISLSYGISLDMRSFAESFPPISLVNARQLNIFFGKIRSFDGTPRLCIKVNASCNKQASDTTPVIRPTLQTGNQVHPL
ncbi:Uncharacterized protein Rs2_23006 [Raphanus sativus]|nr:Uncharacterized protein Rs2_23006 [Raphanus sativus]